MKLEFKNGVIPDNLYQELDFTGYLSTLQIELPVLSYLTLPPLDGKEATEHFGRLTKLQAQIARYDVNLDLLIGQCQKLPLIDYLLPFFKDGQLESYHFFDLGRFVRESLILESLESELPLQDDSNSCQKIENILQKTVTEDFSSLRLTPAEQDLQSNINDVNETINKRLSSCEQKIYQETGLKMIHPFPKEIEKGSETVAKIQACSLVTLTEKGDLYQVTMVLEKSIKTLIKQKEAFQQSWKQIIAQKLDDQNRELHDLYRPFMAHYARRKTRIFDYVLLHATHKHQLCFPEISPVPGVQLEKGELPLLKNQAGYRYKPLNLSLNTGVNVLFGANMTGKTTVLKTLYFHLNLARFGLPVPATCFKLGIPEQVNLQLRNSGQIDSGLSGFGDEIRFFCKIDHASSIYLIDELFHSTDPVNGVKLTEAFLSALTESNSIILCTSHYPEILALAGITLFKMKDREEVSDHTDLKAMLEKVPYEIENVSMATVNDSSPHTNMPLKVALRFPLPESILKNIRKQLED